jgi:uncharacterized phiE125 gp8 family phage protein
MKGTFMSISLITSPALEPVSLEEAKLFLKIDHDAEDELLNDLIKAARENGEQYTGRAFITQTLCAHLNLMKQSGSCVNVAWYLNRGWLTSRLPKAPFQKIVSVETLESHGTFQKMDLKKVHVNTALEPALALLDVPWSPEIKITYIVGYGDTPLSVPAGLRQGLLKSVADMYENRGTEKTVMDHLSGYRLRGV